MDHSAEVTRIIVIYDITLFVAVIGLPVIFMAFAYARILYEVHRQTTNIQKHNTPGWQETRRSTRQEWKVATIFLVMLLVFVICWVPYYLLQLQQVLKEQFLYLSDLAAAILYWLRLLTSLINPCLYILGKPDFRRAAGLRKRTRRYNSEGTRNSLLKSSSVWSLNMPIKSLMALSESYWACSTRPGPVSRKSWLVTFRARKAVSCFPCLHSRSKFQ